MNKTLNIGLVQINNSFSNQEYLPLSVGLLQAYAQKYASEKLNFLPFVYKRGDSVCSSVDVLSAADVVGFSVYVWNLNISLEIARKIKEVKPETLVVFGGPQVPDNAEAFLREHRFVDIVCHGEGEQVFLNILEHARKRDWRAVASTSFILADDTYVSNPKQIRINDLSKVPSPYLNRIFDYLISSEAAGHWLGLWETNRGCPFSCAFCEWGAQAFNKVCCFDMDRLQDEMRWFAVNKIEFIFCCDANFGLLDRDLEITEHMVKTKEEYGYPQAFSVQSSKNATDRVYRIQKMLADKGLSKGVLLAVQSVHPPALKNVSRSNISMEMYDELQRRFRRAGIQTFTDVILGLPGETYDSFAEGISLLMDRGQHNRIQFINLSILGNSRMGDPDYRSQHGMITVESDLMNIHGSSANTGNGIMEKQETVIATATMPRDQWVRARVFSWMAALLHFDKLLQIPFLVCHESAGASFRDMLEAFTEDSCVDMPIISGVRNFFACMARQVQDGGAEYCHSEKWLNIWWPADEYAMIQLFSEGRLDGFYDEAKEILRRHLASSHIAFSVDVLDDVFKLNRNLMKFPFQTGDKIVTLNHNIWEIYQAGLLGEPSTCLDGKWEYRIDRTSSAWKSWNEWCRDVVWYGNKRGAYMYNCREISR